MELRRVGNSWWLAIILALGACVQWTDAAYIQRDAGDDLFNRVVRIEIDIPPSSMAVLRDYRQVWRQARPERLDVPVTVREGGRVYTNVAAHLKGSFTFQPIDSKPSLTLNFGRLARGQRFHGLTKIHLNNSVQDPSYLCEAFARELFNDLGIPSPRGGQALVTINGRDLGLFVVIEGANKQFVKRHFASAKGNLYDGGSGGDVTKALETDSGAEPNNRSDLTNLVKAARAVPTHGLERLREVLDVERFVTFAATEALIVHWDGYAIGGNNYRLFHDVSREKMVFIPHGMDQLFGVSSSPNLSITPRFKGLVARQLFSVPEARAEYLARLSELSTNELRVTELHARVDRLAARVRPALAGNVAALSRFELATRALKQRMNLRAQSVAQQLNQPKQPVTFAGTNPLPLSGWSFKTGTQPAMSGRLLANGKEILRVTGRGSYSSGGWRKTILLDRGRYELTGLARTEGLTPLDAANTNGVILRVSGERRAKGISTATRWSQLSYEFDVRGIEDVELVCEFRGGSNGSGYFDTSSLQLIRKGPPGGDAERERE